MPLTNPPKFIIYKFGASRLNFCVVVGYRFGSDSGWLGVPNSDAEALVSSTRPLALRVSVLLLGSELGAKGQLRGNRCRTGAHLIRQVQTQTEGRAALLVNMRSPL